MLATGEAEEKQKKRRAESAGGKDVGFMCIFCKSVFWVDGRENSRSKFCPLCGSKLAADSRVWFSRISKEEDEAITKRMCESFSKSSARLASLCPDHSQREVKYPPKTVCISQEPAQTLPKFCEVCGYQSDEVRTAGLSARN